MKEQPLPSDAEIAASLAHFDVDSPPLDEQKLVITCLRVCYEHMPVGIASHDENDGFQFISLGNERTSVSEVVYVLAKHILRGSDHLRDAGA